MGIKNLNIRTESGNCYRIEYQPAGDECEGWFRIYRTLGPKDVRIYKYVQTREELNEAWKNIKVEFAKMRKDVVDSNPDLHRIHNVYQRYMKSQLEWRA